MATNQAPGAEALRIRDNHAKGTPWHRWGPYLAERQWGTVREDYSADGDAWNYFTHDHARSRAYRWGEDGIAGISDRHGELNVALAFWNGKDKILKERMFGLTNSEGNHGEDVKECYWYLEATPTHSYLRMIYRYPQREFPYQELIDRNREAGKARPEVEICDLDTFSEDRFFEIQVEYAKQSTERIYGRVSITNRGPEAATIHVLPTAWFRNTWTWSGEPVRPGLRSGKRNILVNHLRYGQLFIAYEGTPELLFTENETNAERLFGTPNALPYVKDSFHRTIIDRETGITHPGVGTKAAAHYVLDIPPGETKVVRFALTDMDEALPANLDAVVDLRRAECDEYYNHLTPNLSKEVEIVQRQAFAGLIWSKQFYHFDVDIWLKGDPAQPAPPPGRTRNADWRHLHTSEILSMPDVWEYPWFAAWDLAFHTIPLSLVDPTFAKRQLITLLREWYLHPNGQVPAYEWNFSDVNPPVHAWAAWRIYTIERRQTGNGDVDFLKRVFHKLLLNFTWWVNRKDRLGNNVFEGGFLGLDNIGVFDRNTQLPDGSFAEQSDGTAWMGMFCLNMLEISLELSRFDLAYQDVAIKFFEHFLYIAAAMNTRASDGTEMWCEEDGFYYDVLRHPDGRSEQMKIRSMVGLIPLFAVTTFEPEQIESFPEFRRRMQWFLENRAELAVGASTMQVTGSAERLLLSMVTPERLKRIMERVLDPEEFLSDYGLRGVSRVHLKHPYYLDVGDSHYMLDYEPGESTTGAFGGNSNWRGPVWFPLNYLLIESLQKYDFYFGDSLQVPLPSNGGEPRSLAKVAAELEQRLLSLFLPDASGCRPIFHHSPMMVDKDGNPLLLFHEYFHGDTGKGLGASHQTGWTAVIAKLIQQLYVTTPDLR
jgi:Glycosyl hydrolase family 63 C-terminal domain